MASIDTPLMQQWREVKAKHTDALLFFRVGDFYEMFYEDAEEGSRLLGLTLTSRNNGSSRAPLAGIPVHALETYLQKLVRLGRRVAICEQVEDPSQARGIVRRAVTQTLSPGTVLSDGLLEARRNNYLVALAGEPSAGGRVAIASADLSTGEMRVRAVDWEELADALGLIEPAEVLLPSSWELFPVSGAEDILRTYRGDWQFESTHGQEELKRHFRVLNLAGFGLTDHDDSLVGACGALVSYLVETQPSVAVHLCAPRVERAGNEMPLDEMTRRNLELVEPLNRSVPGGTLLAVLDRAQTPMGGRLLRKWLLAPLLSSEAIEERQEGVAELVARSELRERIRRQLAEIRDLERLAMKVIAGRCTPRELLGVQASIAGVPDLVSAIGEAEAPILATLYRNMDPLDDVRTLIERAISPDAPAALGDGGTILSGYDGALDDLRATRDGAVEWIAQLQTSERERTGISSLKVGFNKVFGYYLEVTRARADLVPDNYERRQTLANAERYVTSELKEWEEKVLGAEQSILDLEAQLFTKVREEVAEAVPELRKLAGHIAILDVIAALAEAADRQGYVCPEVHSGLGLEIRDGRHPVVETMMAREDFIPNDVHLDGASRIMILTGPNMAGKSTLLRQVGLIVLLAQIGSFVPASSARIGIVDRIFTRVGASDNLVRGQSTFMVEMNETAAILNMATNRSLVLLDEIGRGTSTWDGLSVATAVTEYLHENIGSLTIFATHYHELTKLADRLPAVANFSVAIKEEGERIVFLRSLVKGGSDRSFGVEVARMAGLPSAVVARARDLLVELEAQASRRHPNGSAATPSQPHDQLRLFDTPHPVVERLRVVDPDHLTPMQALSLIAELATHARS
ncbi:MAG TPA: DNA mismatch repair protein MutS [Longimicrobiaceae bacterium]|nr:DNA mismatch repair protein MutS [Longimicrobiaceae bacterium]